MIKLATFAVNINCIFIKTWAVVFMWTWAVAPLGVRAPSYWQALIIVALVGMTTRTVVSSDVKPDMENLDRAFNHLGATIAILGVAWLIYTLAGPF